ncbi:hypothetical protein CHELA20_52703 [Hyphomicrobiales bacterium]|nr:hypothetical protein CHELA41_22222 [Hyphomicrobiales bacterium]CAH1682667.1 hypothetical protein CHELA20_52703 [Hyphomicrobiales bacterium]
MSSIPALVQRTSASCPNPGSLPYGGDVVGEDKLALRKMESRVEFLLAECDPAGGSPYVTDVLKSARLNRKIPQDAMIAL